MGNPASILVETVSSFDKYHERLLCVGSYQHIWREINRRIMDERKKSFKGVFSDNEDIESIIFTFYGTNSSIIYRQWVEDGKRLSLDSLIDIADKLICFGMQSVVKKK